MHIRRCYNTATIRGGAARRCWTHSRRLFSSYSFFPFSPLSHPPPLLFFHCFARPSQFFCIRLSLFGFLTHHAPHRSPPFCLPLLSASPPSPSLGARLASLSPSPPTRHAHAHRDTSCACTSHSTLLQTHTMCVQKPPSSFPRLRLLRSHTQKAKRVFSTLSSNCNCSRSLARISGLDQI